MAICWSLQEKVRKPVFSWRWNLLKPGVADHDCNARGKEGKDKEKLFRRPGLFGGLRVLVVRSTFSYDLAEWCTTRLMGPVQTDPKPGTKFLSQTTFRNDSNYQTLTKDAMNDGKPRVTLELRKKKLQSKWQPREEEATEGSRAFDILIWCAPFKSLWYINMMCAFKEPLIY